MTLDTRLRTQLTSAVADTTTPPGLARAALVGGRRRRRRRTAGALALAAAAIVAVGGTVLLPDDSPAAREARVADGGTSDTRAALAWARSLPQGPGAALPFFGEGGLWSHGTRYDVPESVNRTVAPREVAGGWLVFVGEDEDDMSMAVMSPEGALRELPGKTTGHGMYDSYAIAVSPDGRRVAFRDLVVDVTTMDWMRVPHLPESDADTDDFATAIKMVGFTDEGLVYEGAPFRRGFGTHWLLRDDGTTAEVDPPAGHISDGDPADVALRFDYPSDGSDTCTTSYLLAAGSWSQDGDGCMGRRLGEALTVSPDHQWLVTDDLPEVWDLREGVWSRVDMPAHVGKAQMDAQMGGVVWEDADSFLLPVSDRWDDTVPIGKSYVHTVQVVRCTMGTGACERAGEEQEVRVTTSMWGTTDLRFARP